ncbi:MAG: rRNA ((1915)-N(3))-methyltransferase RlmH [Bacteroidota bacterium]|jgi:23S rRNA (pseudouridine1915-N3)-methyltransferase
MKVKFVVIGKTAFDDLKVGEQRYQSRLIHYCQFERLELPDVKNPKALSKAQIKEKEGQLLLEKLQPQDFVVLLDENGQHFSSEELASWIDKKQLQHAGPFVFVIGGAYGFSEAVYQRADYKLALSKMTFSHQMVRMIFLEQLYRAYSILKGEPYHHA